MLREVPFQIISQKFSMFVSILTWKIQQNWMHNLINGTHLNKHQTLTYAKRWITFLDCFNQFPKSVFYWQHPTSHPISSHLFKLCYIAAVSCSPMTPGWEGSDKKLWKLLFQPAFGVGSTQTLISYECLICTLVWPGWRGWVLV